MCQVGLARVEAKFSRDLVCSFAYWPSALNLDWYCPDQQSQYVYAGLHNSRNMIPISFQTFEDRTFLSFPRYRCGVSATLVSMSMEDSCRKDPLLSPFPNWSMQNFTDFAGMVSVTELYLDVYDVLWALDIGVLYPLEMETVIRAPHVYGFCPRTGKVMSHFSLSGMVCEDSRLHGMVVENTEDGQTFIYVSDATNRAIIVWNVDASAGYKVMLPKLVAGCDPEKDVLYLALINRQCDGNRLYFTYLYSRILFYIKTCHIRAGNLEGTIMYEGVKPGHLVVLGTDGGRTMYFRLRGNPEIYMWNTLKQFKPRNMILIQKSTDPKFPTHVSLGYRNLMWSLDSNFYDYLLDQHDSVGAQPYLHPLVRFCDEEKVPG